MIIDIIANDSTGVDCPKFAVDLSVDRVPLQAAPFGILYDAVGNGYFAKGDNFILLSFGIRLPLGFEIEYEDTNASGKWGNCLSLQLRYKPEAVVSLPLTPDSVWLPFGNYEMNYGTFFNMDGLFVAGNNYQLQSNVLDEKAVISMVNVPAELDEIVYYCPIFWKVAHTLPMEGTI